MDATAAQIETIKALLASGLTLTSSNRGGWNRDALSGAWIDHQLSGDPLPAKVADMIIDFLDGQAARRRDARAAIVCDIVKG